MLRTPEAVPSVAPSRIGRHALVFLHGLLGRVTNWDGATRHFRDRCRLLPVSFPIYEPEAPYHTVKSLTAHVLTEMDAAGMDKAVLFGNSMGGQIALNVALAAPERVSGLVLTGSAGLLERGFTKDMPMRPSPDYLRERMHRIFYNPIFATDELVADVHGLLQVNKNKLRLIKLARRLKLQNLHDELPRISMPTLLIWGREDRITPLPVAETFAERMPNARLEVLDCCGHAPNIERPEEFNRLAEEFLCEIGCG